MSCPKSSTLCTRDSNMMIRATGDVEVHRESPPRKHRSAFGPINDRDIRLMCHSTTAAGISILAIALKRRMNAYILFQIWHKQAGKLSKPSIEHSERRTLQVEATVHALFLVFLLLVCSQREMVRTSCDANERHRIEACVYQYKLSIIIYCHHRGLRPNAVNRCSSTLVSLPYNSGSGETSFSVRLKHG